MNGEKSMRSSPVLALSWRFSRHWPSLSFSRPRELHISSSCKRSQRHGCPDRTQAQSPQQTYTRVRWHLSRRPAHIMTCPTWRACTTSSVPIAACILPAAFVRTSACVTGSVTFHDVWFQKAPVLIRSASGTSPLEDKVRWFCKLRWLATLIAHALAAQLGWDDLLTLDYVYAMDKAQMHHRNMWCATARMPTSSRLHDGVDQMGYLVASGSSTARSRGPTSRTSSSATPSPDRFQRFQRSMTVKACTQPHAPARAIAGLFTADWSGPSLRLQELLFAIQSNLTAVVYGAQVCRQDRLCFMYVALASLRN